MLNFFQFSKFVMDKTSSRRYLRAKRGWKDERAKAQSSNFKNVETSTPCGSKGVEKRKFEDFDESPVKRHRQYKPSESRGTSSSAEHSFTKSPAKFSANDRLKRYRRTLDYKRNELVHVHKVLSSSTISNDDSNASLSTSSFIDKHIEKSVESNSSYFQSNRAQSNSTIASKSDNLEDTDMDWSPVDQEEVVSDIQKLRDTIKSQPNPTYKLLSTKDNTSIDSTESDEGKLLYIIVDTNIFISHLALIKSISKLKRKGRYKPTIYIPWMVLQELDYFKDGRTGSSNMQTIAKRAVSFINEMLESKNETLRGQTVYEALEHKFSNANADDSILFSCMQLEQSNEKIMLLSNDVNLRNKALIHGIAAFSPNNVIERINETTGSASISEKSLASIKRVFLNTCTEIVKFELEKAYGLTVYNMILRPPWSLKDCIGYLKRFWTPVFSVIITQKQCAKIVDELYQFIEIHKEIQSSNAEEFVKLSLSLCVYFKNCLVKHSELIKMTISQIQDNLT